MLQLKLVNEDESISFQRGNAEVEDHAQNIEDLANLQFVQDHGGRPLQSIVSHTILPL